MSVKGLVFKSRDYIGSAQPPATVLEDTSRYGYIANFTSDGNPNWVQLPSGLWVIDTDGDDDKILFPSASDVFEHLVDKMALIIWIKPDAAAATNDAFISKYGGSSSEQAMHFSMASNNKVIFYLKTGGVLRTPSSDIDTVYKEVWTCLAATYDGSFIRLYGNGVSNQASPFAATGDVFKGLNPLVIGSRWDDGVNSFPFPGLIGSTRFYNHAPSAEQIAAIYQSEKHWFGK